MKPNRFSNNLTNADIHTSGYAEAAGGTFGQASTETFSNRLQIENSRKTIGNYMKSSIGTAAYRRETGSLRVPPRPQSNTAASRSSFNTGSTSFKEPPARSYNPYA